MGKIVGQEPEYRCSDGQKIIVSKRNVVMREEKIRFSIIMPAYNAEKHIVRGINSVLNQTFQNFELIIINDGSGDKTSELVKRFSDERLILIEKEHEGISIARNTGIRQARGSYICFLDADDEFLPHHLSHIDQLIYDYPTRGFFSTTFNVSMRYDANVVITRETTGSVDYYRNASQEKQKRGEIIWTGCVCIKKELFDLYGMFEPGVQISEDTDMWRRIYVHTGIVYSDNVTVKRNRDGSQASIKYPLYFEADPLNRFPALLQDKTIADDIKDSLRGEYEQLKYRVVRSYLYIGNKKQAMEHFKKIDKKRFSKVRILTIYIVFLCPTILFRKHQQYRHKGYYEFDDKE